MSAEHIIPLYQLFLDIFFPVIYYTAKSSAYNSLRSMSFVHIFLLFSSTTATYKNGTKAFPCVKPTFTLNSPDSPGPHMQHLLRVLIRRSLNSVILIPVYGTSIHLRGAVIISFGIAYRPSPCL
ncbi:hypothetical protein NP493_247g03108 [Ridgeia piscesae]|uniref:Uncharacterized protein n=1 Tax=Ridgeia piscesae TaxID=27915 RepID=A0AAD9NYZ1_RIDPI|nr:hypothetical protein NP493_247g03108 [Ridgeia piscesae]